MQKSLIIIRVRTTNYF